MVVTRKRAAELESKAAAVDQATESTVQYSSKRARTTRKQSSNNTDDANTVPANTPTEVADLARDARDRGSHGEDEEGDDDDDDMAMYGRRNATANGNSRAKDKGNGKGKGKGKAKDISEPSNESISNVDEDIPVINDTLDGIRESPEPATLSTTVGPALSLPDVAPINSTILLPAIPTSTSTSAAATASSSALSASETKKVSHDEERVHMTVIHSVHDVQISLDDAVGRLKEMFPDATDTYLKKLVEGCTLVEGGGDGAITEDTIQRATAAIIETKGRYPKVLTGAERMKHEEKQRQKEMMILQGTDYLKIDTEPRPQRYRECARVELMNKFSTTPLQFIKRVLDQHNWQYLPSLKALEKYIAMPRPPYAAMKVPHRKIPFNACPEFTAELEWHEAFLAKQQRIEEEKRAEEAAERKAEESGEFIECGCCFGEFWAKKVSHCRAGHHFCLECCKAHAENIIGLRKTKILCMSSEVECEADFERCEMERFLEATTIAAWERICQETDIRLAFAEQGADSCYSTCPFCPYGEIIDNPDEKELRCKNPECEIISCRSCKKRSHIPWTCEEANRSRLESAQNLIAEAMSEALMRTCSRCNNRFFKTEGCNMITCTCGQKMCYICKIPLKDYGHFNRNGAADSSLCPLFDDTVLEDAVKIKRAAATALQKQLEDNPHLERTDLETVISVNKPRIQT
ncbi:hypothetical protein GQ42DRAFT_164510 [Ramicandelaber brevisporus]|nr:hypothetical protein GQ42DRAFT_164510 [Ramicandelaber brevisporus]